MDARIRGTAQLLRSVTVSVRAYPGPAPSCRWRQRLAAACRSESKWQRGIDGAKVRAAGCDVKHVPSSEVCSSADLTRCETASTAQEQGWDRSETPRAVLCRRDGERNLVLAGLGHRAGLLSPLLLRVPQPRRARVPAVAPRENEHEREKKTQGLLEIGWQRAGDRTADGIWE
ncbi:hypothetical protein BC628DRAFT_1393819 [Trametes gibbosa]|nr:hypothetical protein BC628DRAFT_1393819 [Trametes gibbosa]